jgi:hypothetical protein
VQSNLPLSHSKLRSSGPILVKEESERQSQVATPSGKYLKENSSAGVYLKDMKLINQSKDNLNNSQHGRQSLSSQFDRPNSPPTGHYLKQKNMVNSAVALITKVSDVPVQIARFIQKKPSSNQKLNNSAGNLYSARNKLANTQLQNSTLNETNNLNSLLNNHFKMKGQMLPGGLLTSAATNTGIATAKLMEKIKATKAGGAVTSAVPLQATKPRQTAPTATRPLDLEVLTSTSKNLTLSGVSGGMTGFNLAAPDHSSRPIPIHSALNLGSKGKHTTSGAIETKLPTQLSKTASGIANKSTSNDAQKGQFNISLSNAKNVSVYEINNYFGAHHTESSPKRASNTDKNDGSNLNHVVKRQSFPKHNEVTELYGIQPGYNTGIRPKQLGTLTTTPSSGYHTQNVKSLGKFAHQLSQTSKSRLSGMNTMSKESMNESGVSGAQRVSPAARVSIQGDKQFTSNSPQPQFNTKHNPLHSLGKAGLFPTSPKPVGASASKVKIGTYLG